MSSREVRESFVLPRRERWEELEGLLKTGPRTPAQLSSLSRLYRALCADLAAAQSTRQPDDVQRYLDELAGRTHNALYGSRRLGAFNPLVLVAADFPRELRRQWLLFAVASFLFYGPFIVGFVGCLIDPDLASRVLPQSQLSMMEEMYSDSVGRQGTGEDAAMAGFYVWNNVGIAFRCFATGALAGLGPLFYLVHNGVSIGVVGGYLTAVGRGWNLLMFTCGHTAWELTGVVVAGTAGLKLGWALLVTNGLTRAASLRKSGPILFRLVAGAATMLLIAALIEGFWSASPVPWWLKLPFAALQILIVVVWLTLGGRRLGRS